MELLPLVTSNSIYVQLKFANRQFAYEYTNEKLLLLNKTIINILSNFNPLSIKIEWFKLMCEQFKSILFHNKFDNSCYEVIEVLCFYTLL